MRSYARPLTAVILLAGGGAACSGDALAEPVELGRTSISKADAQIVQPPRFYEHDPLGADSPWFKEFKRDISQDPANPHSDEMLARMAKNGGHLYVGFSGSWTPENWNWYTFPWNVGPGNVTKLKVPSTWAYSAPGTEYYLQAPPVVIQGSTGLDYYTSYPPPGDHHYIVYVRDEVTGGFDSLWEYYQLYVTRDGGGAISAIGGASWRKFDLKNGENPASSVSSTDAAGLPIAPLLLRYEEVASGTINHVIRTTLNNADIEPTQKWPARASAGSYNPFTGIPYGGRLRLKREWLQKNGDAVLGVGTQARVIAEALARYGLIVSDGTVGSNIDFGSSADLRWEATLPAKLSLIPVTAMEVVDTPAFLNISGPTTVIRGQQASWSFTAQPDDNVISPANINIYTANGAAQVKYMLVHMDQNARKDVRGSYTFNKTGTYSVKSFALWNSTKVGPYIVTVVDTPIPEGGYELLTSSSYLTNQSISLTITAGAPFTGKVTVTPAGGGLSTPVDVIFANEVTRTVGFTPTQAGQVTFSVSNSAGLWDPAPVSVAVSGTAGTATSYSLGLIGAGVAREPVVVTLSMDRPFTGSVLLTPGGCGLSQPALVVFDGEMYKSISLTPRDACTLTVNASNESGLPNPPAVTMTVAGHRPATPRGLRVVE